MCGAHNNLMSIRLEQLRNAGLNLLVYFVVLVEEKSVSRAAKRLRLTQSALSRVLQRLRSLFQDDLLVRVNGMYQPTLRGQEVLKELSIVLPHIDTIISGKAFNPSEEDARFRITLPDSMSHIYGPMFARRHAATPNLEIAFSAYTEERYADLEANSRDLILGADYMLLPPCLRKEVLFNDSFVCVVSKDSSHKHRLSLSQYLASKHICVNTLDGRQPLPDIALAKMGVNRHCAFSVPYFSVALRMVTGTSLIATLPRMMSELLVDRRALRLVKPPKELGNLSYIMIWHKRQEMDPGSLWLRQTMREMTNELLADVRLRRDRVRT